MERRLHQERDRKFEQALEDRKITGPLSTRNEYYNEFRIALWSNIPVIPVGEESLEEAKSIIAELKESNKEEMIFGHFRRLCSVLRPAAASSKPFAPRNKLIYVHHVPSFKSSSLRRDALTVPIDAAGDRVVTRSPLRQQDIDFYAPFFAGVSMEITVESTTPGDKGQLLQYLHQHAADQPFRDTLRTFVIGILFTANVVILMKLSFEEDRSNPTLFESPPLTYEQAAPFLLWMMMAEPHELGWCLPTIELSDGRRVEWDQDSAFLGKGSVGSAYAGKLEGKAVVVKCVDFTDITVLTHEQANLEILAKANVKSVPKVVGRSLDQLALVVHPVAIQWQFLGDKGSPGSDRVTVLRRHFARLVEVLDVVHNRARLVHRDLSISNWFASREDDKREQIHLNDFSTAVVYDGTAHPWQGALEMTGVLLLEKLLTAVEEGDELKSVVHTPADDLEMVCIMYLQAFSRDLYLEASVQRADFSKTCLQEMLQKRRAVMELPAAWLFVQLCRLAQARDYAGMIALLR